MNSKGVDKDFKIIWTVQNVLTTDKYFSRIMISFNHGCTDTFMLKNIELLAVYILIYLVVILTQGLENATHWCITTAHILRILWWLGRTYSYLDVKAS